MFARVLIANRGEIAVRIIRACHNLGIKTIAVYSIADQDALFTRLADEKYCIGGTLPKESYLNKKLIVELAVKIRAHAIHPGYGFLSEDSEFAKLCEKEKIIFIGPSARSIGLMGNKSVAITQAIECGMPVLPGSKGIVKSHHEALEFARKIGFPVLIKATAGGGGKGMRVVQKEENFIASLQSAQLEAKNAFANGDVYLEKFLIQPKHVEVQIIADKYGNAITVSDRDCSIQRNSQKVIEEGPASSVSVSVRKKMGEAALRLVRHVKYVNAGTIEFLVDKKDKFYFMEMNTRIQVEHPVTEMISNVNLVEEQIKIAFSNKLSFKQSSVNPRGHAIEVRINAENPKLNFMPSPGKIEKIHLPGGPDVRCDFGFEAGDVIQPFYDSLIGKIIVWGKTRTTAINRLKTAIEEFFIEGVNTNIEFIYNIIDSNEFSNNNYYTSYVSENFKKLIE